MIKNLVEIISLAKQKQKKRLAVVFAQDVHTIEAVYEAVKEGIVDATLTGEKKVIEKICQENQINSSVFEIIDVADQNQAGGICCDEINNGNAQLIMKGSITTDDYMRCILNKERGIMIPGSLLTHVTVFEISVYPKLLIVCDVAVIPYPTIEQKEKMLKFLINTAQKLGNPNPLCALIAPSEKPTKKIVSSSDAMVLADLAKTGAFGHAIIDGPMALDLAIDIESADIKHYHSPVAGKADCILFPNIDAANVFYKTTTKFLKGESAAMVVGAKVPAILTSRGDSSKSKLSSIALAAACTDL
jgi:phosphate butyryltransferase